MTHTLTYILRRSLFGLILLMALSACSTNNNPQPRKVVTTDTVFTLARVRTHGQYYKGLDLNVVSLDLYSAGLRPSLDSLHNTGTNLYLSDVFTASSATRLEEGVYTIDSVPSLHSALPALTFDGQITGSCLLLLRDGELDQLTLFSGGQFAVSQEGDSTVIRFSLTTADNRTYSAVYRGIPVYEP